MFKTSITWSSLEDLQGTPDFNTDRSKLLTALKSMEKTSGIPEVDEQTFTASITFQDRISAEYWLDYITSLAEKYNKTIVSKTIETV